MREPLYPAYCALQPQVAFMILRTGVISTFLSVFAVIAVGDDPVFSGPQVGESLVPFKVLAVGGTQVGTEIDPIERAAGKPTLFVFVHKLTRPGMALTRGLTKYATDQEGVASGIIWLDDDKSKAEAYLKRAQSSLSFTAPVGISIDGGEGPGAYGLNRNVELTILVAKNNKVTANFALVQPSLTEGPKIAGELAKLIGRPAPTAEQLAKLVSPRGNAMRQRPAAGDDSMDLRTTMRGLISSSGDSEDFDSAVKAVEKWVGDDKKRRAQLQRMCKAILERGIGSEKAQKQFKQWLEMKD